ncbi:MAG TPA: hypothetical protein ENG81_01085 [Candidatus Bathyarchaeota archaeon]|nr:hypothetical protein [Candidatus Bathyarchaeota archaeon]
MASFAKVNSFVENLAEQAIDLSGSGLTIALTNTGHTAAWDELADLTEVSYANCSSRVITVSTSAQTSGTYKLVCADLVLTASGAVGPFRYVYIYDDDSTGDKLIAYYDYGSAVTLADGDTFTVNFSADDGVLTIA